MAKLEAAVKIDFTGDGGAFTVPVTVFVPAVFVVVEVGAVVVTVSVGRFR